MTGRPQGRRSPAKKAKPRKPRPAKIATPRTAKPEGDIWPLARVERVDGKSALVRPPNPMPDEMLHRVCPALAKPEFRTLKRNLRAIERAGCDLRTILLGGFWLAYFSLKKAGRKHVLTKPTAGLTAELYKAAKQLPLLSKAARMIRQLNEQYAKGEIVIFWPETADMQKRLFHMDVIENVPEILEVHRRGLESFLKKWGSSSHPSAEIDEQVIRIHDELSPLKGDQVYGHLYAFR